jgi:GNAT superfamily N-acetyltransferase
VSIVRKATSADLPRLCRTMVHAFADDPVMRWLFPDDTEFFEGNGASVRFLFWRWLAYDQTFTTDDSVAVAAFIPPGRPDLGTAPEPNSPSHPAERIEKFIALGGCLQEHTPPEPHWYLNLLATHPHWQRQGLGALMISPIAEICDREGLPLFLETETAANVAYYGHLGFTVRSEWDVPLNGPHMWGMIRAPRT